MAKWLKVKPGQLPPHPVVGGSVPSGEILYIVRGVIGDGKMPGNILASADEAHVSYGGEQHSTRDYEILSNPSQRMKWVFISATGSPPDGAFQGGNEQDGTPLYVGRALTADGHFVPGKVNFRHGACYIPYDNLEFELKTGYYVLCQ